MRSSAHENCFRLYRPLARIALECLIQRWPHIGTGIKDLAHIMEKKVKVLVSHYQPQHMAGATLWPKDMFTPWDVRFNLGSKLLEFDLLKKIRSERVMDNNDYSGLISHSAFEKLALPLDYLENEIQDGLNNEVDVILINPAIGCNAFFKNGIEQGQLIGQNKMGFLFNRLGFSDYATITLPYYSFIMCSYIIATKSFWDVYFDFVEGVLDDAQRIAKDDNNFAQSYFGDSNYKIKPGLFDYRPFIIERLPQILITKFGMKIKYIESPKATFAVKFGHTAKLIYDMYQLKKLGMHEPEKLDLWNKIRQPFLAHEALCYKIATRGEFSRTPGQAQENMRYIHNGDFI